MFYRQYKNRLFCSKCGRGGLVFDAGCVWAREESKGFLEAKGIEVFLPVQDKCIMQNGKRKNKQVSLIPNFLFVKSTEAEMKNMWARVNSASFIIIMYLIGMKQEKWLAGKASNPW